MATYHVSGVWKNVQKEITHVFIHLKPVSSEMGTGKKTLESDVIQMYNKGDRFYAVTWNYNTAGWDVAQEIIPVVNRVTRKTYLRTHRDNTPNNNLDNLINYKIL